MDHSASYSAKNKNAFVNVPIKTNRIETKHNWNLKMLQERMIYCTDFNETV